MSAIKFRFNLRSVSETQLCGVSLVCFFAQDAIRVLIAVLLPFLSYQTTVAITIFLMYAPLTLAICTGTRKWSRILGRFLLALITVGLIFLVTYLIHPEYEDWFFHGSYPIWEEIFRPNQFLYSILFVSAIDDPKDLIKYMKTACFILLIYYSYRFYKAQTRGYWLITNTAAGARENAYDLSFGYDHMIVLTTFLSSFFREKKKRYLLYSIISFAEILLGGSRGPLLGVAILLVILYFFYRDQMDRVLRLFIAFVVIGLVSCWAILGIDSLFVGIGVILQKVFGASSRTIQSLLGGGSELMDDNGRQRVYRDAMEMIRTGFWGYGAYGDRYVLGRWLWAGYCHQVFLELIIDFGWIIGGVLSVMILVYVFKMLFSCKDPVWFTCFLIFFVPCIKLLLSGSFWFSEAFFSSIALRMMYKDHLKNQKLQAAA